MSFDHTILSEPEAIQLLNKEETHFFDFTEIGDLRQLQRKACAVLNSDGGEILVGIVDKRKRDHTNIFEAWKGFETIEHANDAIRNVSTLINPAPTNVGYDFFSISSFPQNGYVLRISINEKSSFVHSTADGKVYIRKNADIYELKNEQISNLRLSKGVESYENQIVDDCPIDELTESGELKRFLQEYSPRTEPLVFLSKNRLLKKQQEEFFALYGGVLLYHENPSAALPKKCSIQIARYNTSEVTPLREHLARQEAIEGPLYQQIQQAVSVISTMIESVSIMGPQGLENAKYPREAIHEVLTNAVIHRDYNLSDDIAVFVYNNRIEIRSPGTLPGHITQDNILNERYARNPKLVRLLSKYPNAPNKDIGEGLNTAFQKMKEMKLKDPIIRAEDRYVSVILPHEHLASPEEQILEYLNTNVEINNPTVRQLTGIGSENKVKGIFYRMKAAGLLEPVPGKRGTASAWRRPVK